MSSVIALEHVSKRFEGKRQVIALDGVSLAIERGEMVSIIGPSGSGKSTLLNLVGGLDRPTSGQVRIDGEALADLSDDDLTRVRRDKIGFIFQFFNLLPTLSCLENVGLPLHLRGWPRQKVDERSRELLTLVQLGHRLNHLPEELSGGERQRVAIARALSIYPPIILADEPTGNLDTHTGEEILALVRDLHGRLGSTVVIVTHDMKVAESCPRTIALRDGRIVAGRAAMILLRLISWPYFRKHVLRTILTVAGIVLGVAVFVGMHTANQSVLFAFSRTVDRIAGKTEIQVTAGEAGFAEDILEKVQSAAIGPRRGAGDRGGRGHEHRGRRQPARARRGHDRRPQPARLRPRQRQRRGHRRSARVSRPARLDHPDEAVRGEERSRRQRSDPAGDGARATSSSPSAGS